MPASRCGFKTKLLCSTPRRKRLRPRGSMTGSTFATKDYGAVNLRRSAFISAIPRRSTDHPDSGYGSATEGCVDSLNGAASLEWPTPRTPGTPRSRAYALTCTPYGQKTHPRFRRRGVYPKFTFCPLPGLRPSAMWMAVFLTAGPQDQCACTVLWRRPSLLEGHKRANNLAVSDVFRKAEVLVYKSKQHFAKGFFQMRLRRP